MYSTPVIIWSVSNFIPKILHLTIGQVKDRIQTSATAKSTSPVLLDMKVKFLFLLFMNCANSYQQMDQK